ncbi:dihydroorotase [Staphylothermus hellenicus]|uniref:Amidohydrolase n=1 Tax=Staphylothermus hellenicus (strain DSM 12710 / JCM 10830 / BK20S6-10-b1 / P8) TaxID=591019 RepID=D7DCB6_STAHD|nr:dihydroorotase family protein [Staphylothermus hellenicus]ADI31813.1 amidohydrolase [Staphylothermus hellenicus DSM 12710]
MRIGIRDAKVWVGDGFTEAFILVEDGKITSISKKQVRDVDELLDAYGQPIIPGGIDIHAHVYDPEYTMNEDWESGSLAAAYGDITSIYDMPLRVYVDNKDIVEKKIDEAKKHSYINYGIHAGFMNASNKDKIPELADMGIKGYKIFTARPFKAEETSLGDIFELVRDVNGVVIAHAEDDGLIEYGYKRYKERDDIVAYHMHRSSYCEAAAIMRLGYYALETEAPLHIAHVSSSEGIEAIEFLRRKGARITAETCPHFLYFTREDSKKYGAYLKLAPTLKTGHDREALWKALAEGKIEAYVSDNAPAPRELKETNVWNAWGGIPNLEIMGPFLFTYGVLKRIISFDKFVDVFSRNPAKIMGIYPEKGELAVGSDADLVVLETRRAKVISASDHHHKVDWTPWEGMELFGAPIHVIVNGEIIIEEGQLVGKPGKGKYLSKKTRKIGWFL